MAPGPVPGSAAPGRGATHGVAVGEVICPSCRMPTMATPGTASVCFSCGQPMDATAPVASGAPVFALTGALPSSLAPPVDPYGQGLRVRGAAGDFPLTAAEAAVGRDPMRCRILLTEPRVSGVHAHLKVVEGVVQVKDGGSNNGTYVDGARIAANVWVPVRLGGEVRFGPVTFTVST